MQRRSFLKAVVSLGAGATPLLSAAKEASFSDSPLLAAAYGKIPDAGAIRRIVSAGPVADVLLLSLVPEKLTGLSTHNIPDDHKKYLSGTVRALPHTGRIAGRASTFPMERLLELKPDIIVDIGSTSASYTSTAERVHQQTGIPYVLVSGRLADSAGQLRLLGKMLGAPGSGKPLADFAESVLSEARSVREKVRTIPGIFFGRGADGLETGLSGSMHTEVIDRLGARNVAAAAGKDLIARISMEQLIQWDPDVILTQDPNFFQRLQTEPVWKDYRAVRQGRYHLVPSVPFGWMDHPPCINRLLGLSWGMHVLYPDQWPLERYRKEVVRYFELFYGYALTPEALSAIDGFES
jgi:iron complex transport system substrate-binding protein